MPKDHPKRAASIKSQCLAYSKEHRRCRLERDANSKTCSIHRNYYRDFWTNTYHSYGNIEWATSRQRAEYEFQLQNGHVEVPEWYFKRLKRSDRKEYLWLIQVAKCNPLCNREVFYYIITCMIDELLTFYDLPKDRIRLLTNEFELLLQTPKCCQEAFTVLLFKALIAHKHYSHLITESRSHMFWYRTFTFIKPWTQLLKSPVLHDCIAEFRNKLNTIGMTFLAQEEGIGWGDDPGVGTVEQLLTVLNNVENVVKNSLNERTMILRQNAQELKRDLAAIAFAPERVSRLLDAGYELEDI
jgi:hypothetical protein